MCLAYIFVNFLFLPRLCWEKNKLSTSDNKVLNFLCWFILDTSLSNSIPELHLPGSLRGRSEPCRVFFVENTTCSLSLKFEGLKMALREKDNIKLMMLSILNFKLNTFSYRIIPFRCSNDPLTFIFYYHSFLNIYIILLTLWLTCRLPFLQITLYILDRNKNQNLFFHFY